MEIFGIGPLELILIVLLALIVLGPKEMIDMSKKAAGWLRKVRQSDTWKTTREVMDIPNKVMKETGLEDEIRELNAVSRKTLSPATWDGKPLSSSKSNTTTPTESPATDSNPTEIIKTEQQTGDSKDAS